MGNRKKNNNTKGKILKIRTAGYNNTKNKDRPIGKKIRDYYKNQCCVVCGNSSIIIDHKNDLYNDPKVLDVNTQTVDDFQPLCNSCNLRKRQVCKKSREIGKRYPATNIPIMKVFGIDFIEGDETLDISNPESMVGTYWYDPKKFMECVKNSLSDKKNCNH